MVLSMKTIAKKVRQTSPFPAGIEFVQDVLEEAGLAGEIEKYSKLPGRSRPELKIRKPGQGEGFAPYNVELRMQAPRIFKYASEEELAPLLAEGYDNLNIARVGLAAGTPHLSEREVVISTPYFSSQFSHRQAKQALRNAAIHVGQVFGVARELERYTRVAQRVAKLDDVPGLVPGETFADALGRADLFPSDMDFYNAFPSKHPDFFESGRLKGCYSETARSLAK